MFSISTVQQAVNPMKMVNKVRPFFKSKFVCLSVCLSVSLFQNRPIEFTLCQLVTIRSRDKSGVENVQFQSN